MTPDLSRTVLLPIDVQQGFDDPAWPRRWNADMEANGRALLARWRAAGAPIIHVRHDSVQPGSTLAPGHPGNGFRGGFEPLPGEPVVAKSVNSAFIGTDLDLRLRRLGAERIVTFGISTDMCVSTTIRTGANMGWTLLLVPDACDCFDLPDGQGGTLPARAIHDAHIATLAFEFCEVALTRELIS
ncbi:cysteine hydrolase family protein [Sphingosinicella sp. LHD-64]|uniref:cysteine hydrolase family protein n=1 Tax=Sphingosinicella sp. LHD-64 TaxID=3072139 RepID=UPI00280E4881|nr:cysteine hydrolase family protein [Sphingosinicella sp. LHD-64]MDQ8755930.1 cysteine hydrolase family protein [Sphingosinicella sp. LHD-64]